MAVYEKGVCKCRETRRHEFFERHANAGPLEKRAREREQRVHLFVCTKEPPRGCVRLVLAGAQRSAERAPAQHRRERHVPHTARRGGRARPQARLRPAPHFGKHHVKLGQNGVGRLARVACVDAVNTLHLVQAARATPRAGIVALDFLQAAVFARRCRARSHRARRRAQLGVFGCLARRALFLLGRFGRDAGRGRKKILLFGRRHGAHKIRHASHGRNKVSWHGRLRLRHLRRLLRML